MQQTVTPVSTKAIIISLLLILLALANYFLKIDPSSPVQYLSYVILIGGIIWSVMSYGKQINYHGTFGNYFAHGFKVAALITAIMVIFIIVFIYLFPDMKEMAIDAARKNMAGKNMTEEQITQGVEMTRKYFGVFAVGGTLLMYLIVGCLISLIGAAITKKDPHNPAHDINQTGQ